jgi:hypothetical protein
MNISIGTLGDIRGISVADCTKCCYNTIPDIQPYINGTHMINGTDIIPVTFMEIGYGFNDSLILPCAKTYSVPKLYYSSDAKKNVPKMSIFLLVVVISSMI